MTRKKTNEKPKHANRMYYRFWEHEVWDDSTTPLVPFYCNIVDGCDLTVAVGKIEYCTGIEDKNGQPIFEGDLVRLVDSMYTYEYEVRWNHDWACFELYDLDSMQSMHIEQDDNLSLVVFGNKHQKEYK